MALEWDIHNLLVFAGIAVFMFLLLGAGVLGMSGALSISGYISGTTFALVNIFFGVAYFLYYMYNPGKVTPKYENTDFRMAAIFAAVGVALQLLVVSNVLSVSPYAEQVYTWVAQLATSLVGILENAFFILVVGDFFVEQALARGLERKYAYLVGSVAAGVVGGIWHAYVFGPSQMFQAMMWFFYWAIATFVSGSSLYADFHHSIGNAIGFVRSVTGVVY